MKHIRIALIIGLVSITAQAQKVIEKNFNYTDQEIELDVKFAKEIEVKTWDKSTVYFKADITVEKTKYLELYELDIKENSSKIKIESDAIPMFKKAQKDWEKANPNVKNRGSNLKHTFNFVLYVPKNAKFKVSSINGHLKSEGIDGTFTADLINGDINIKKYSGDLTLNTINGEIDLIINDARMTAETINGQIYADGKLNVIAKDRVVGQHVKLSPQNAANRLKLSTINGNMYLRI